MPNTELSWVVMNIMQRFRCSNRDCGWIGTHAEQREVRLAEWRSEMQCPRCANNSFYQAKEGEVEKRKSGHQLITLERQRQVKIEGWTVEHDDGHQLSELARAAVCYAQPNIKAQSNPPPVWPWHDGWWKPSDDPIRNLVKAGALIAAEIDRLQRLQNERAEP